MAIDEYLAISSVCCWSVLEVGSVGRVGRMGRVGRVGRVITTLAELN